MNSPRIGDTLALQIHAVTPRDRPVDVARQGETQSPQAAPRPGRRDPALVRLDRIATDSQQVAVVCLEFVEPLAEADQLRRADQREVSRVKHQDQPSALDNPPARPGSRRLRRTACTGARNAGAGLPISVDMGR